MSQREYSLSFEAADFCKNHEILTSSSSFKPLVKNFSLECFWKALLVWCAETNRLVLHRLGAGSRRPPRQGLQTTCHFSNLIFFLLSWNFFIVPINTVVIYGWPFFKSLCIILIDFLNFLTPARNPTSPARNPPRKGHIKNLFLVYKNSFLPISFHFWTSQQDVYLK